MDLSLIDARISASRADLTRSQEDIRSELESIPEREILSGFKICPECGQETLMLDNGCGRCVNAQCLYSACDV